MTAAFRECSRLELLPEQRRVFSSNGFVWVRGRWNGGTLVSMYLEDVDNERYGTTTVVVLAFIHSTVSTGGPG